MPIANTCRSCGAQTVSTFYEVQNVPVNSVLLMPTREIAMDYPKGDIALGFCQTCGFISNIAFDPDKLEYSSQYEETQGFSPTFNAFHSRLASRLIDRYNLYDKDVIEIGCGKGEFLNMLCEMGNNRGVGFDPSYVSERIDGKCDKRVTFIRDFYSEKYAGYQGDFVCCKMTLEHIQDVSDFVSTVRHSIDGRSSTIVFFQVPDVTRVLREAAFWDIYYEHCSYFSLGSLARLFRKCGFEIVDLSTEYDDQYLMMVARTSNGIAGSLLAGENDLEGLARAVDRFSMSYQQALDVWRRHLQKIRQTDRRAVVWGGGSKGVAFLTTLDISDEIEYVVDINPHRQGTYMAGTGQKIVGPDAMREYRPDVVIVMNPVYREEISRSLGQMGLAPEVLTANLDGWPMHRV